MGLRRVDILCEASLRSVLTWREAGWHCGLAWDSPGPARGSWGPSGWSSPLNSIKNEGLIGRPLDFFACTVTEETSLCGHLTQHLRGSQEPLLTNYVEQEYLTIIKQWKDIRSSRSGTISECQITNLRFV